MNMKNAINLFLLGGIVFLFSCGPSQKEIEAKEEARRDSIRQDSISTALYKIQQDSLARLARIEREAQDSLERIKNQLVQDSIAAVEANKKGKKGKKK